MLKRLLFSFVLVAISMVGYSQCAGIMFNASVNNNTATFVSTIPAGYVASGYTWTFGDGGTANSANPVHTYANAGWYNVCMTVWGVTPNNTIFQCSLCDSVNISGGAQPCNSNYSSTTSGFTTNFTSLATGPGTITNYAWNFGDGNQSNLQNPAHTYANAGWYNACLTIYGIYNNVTYTCTYCDSVYVSGGAQPCVASYNYSVGANNVVSFTSTSTAPGPISTYQWAFGDGGTANTANPVHTYANPGWYNVCLTISGQTIAGSFQCYFCDSVYVTGGAQPCNSNYSFITSGLTANFTSLATGPGTITNYAWNFGDGNQSNLQNPAHTYANAGWYNACLTIYGIYNNVTYTCTYCDSVYVSGGVQPCNSNYSFTTSGLSANFTSLATGPGTITNYAWNFGDGNQSNLQNPAHTYANAGWYNACLTIYGIYNNVTYTCTYCDSIYVSGGAQPCVASYNYTVGANNVVSFTSTSTAPGPISTYQWAFGDGGTANTANPVHTYANPGWYNVCLTISGQTAAGIFQCYYCDSVYIGNPNPGGCNPSFSFVYAAGNTINFTNTSTGTGTLISTNWTFGDGGTAAIANPSHAYTFGGWYNVCLVVAYLNNNVTTTCTYCDSVYIQGGVNPGGCFVNANYTGSISGNTVSFTNLSTCTGCTSVSYAWNFGDGGTSSLTNPSHTYANGGNYNVCLIATGIDSIQQTCIDTFCYTVIVGASSVNNVGTTLNSLEVYPNPSHDYIEVKLPSSDNFELKIMDVAGKIISTEKIDKNIQKIKLDVSKYANGMYYLQLNSASTKYHSSFIKQE